MVLDTLYRVNNFRFVSKSNGRQGMNSHVFVVVSRLLDVSITISFLFLTNRYLT